VSFFCVRLIFDEQIMYKAKVLLIGPAEVSLCYDSICVWYIVPQSTLYTSFEVGCDYTTGTRRETPLTSHSTSGNMERKHADTIGTVLVP